MELNGIAYLIAGHNSHFSGKDRDYKNFSALNYSRSMNASSRGIRQLYRFSLLCKKRNIELINLSNKGLLDFIVKEDYNKLFID